MPSEGTGLRQVLDDGQRANCVLKGGQKWHTSDSLKLSVKAKWVAVRRRSCKARRWEVRVAPTRRRAALNFDAPAKSPSSATGSTAIERLEIVSHAKSNTLGGHDEQNANTLP